jgi:hypothetical protein
MQKEIIAEYICNLLPSSVRERLLDNNEFTARFGLMPRNVYMAAGSEIDQRKLFDVARQVLMDRKEHVLSDISGHKIHLVLDKDDIVLKDLSGAEGTMEAKLNEFLILSPHPEERRHAIDSLLHYMGPTVPDFSALRTASCERALNDQEAEELLYEAMTGVNARQQKMIRALHLHESTLGDLVPDSLAYYERYCGPNPGNAEPEIYLQTQLPAYRKEMLRRDLARGLDICLYGSLRDDLSPGQWTDHINDDDLWNVLLKCNPNRDPFSLLGALDIALYRQKDERYRNFADEAVIKLVCKNFLRPDGIDAYDLLPPLAELVLNRITTIEGGTLRAPYWKRMCAWMQALFIACQTLKYSLEFEPFKEWITSQVTLAGFYAKILDLRLEPAYQPAAISDIALRQEIVGRLAALQLRHKNEGRETPKADEIDAAILRLTSPPNGLPWSCSLPGPLEGHQDRKPLSLPVEQINEIAGRIDTDMEESMLSMLAHISQIFKLDVTLLESARKLAQNINHIGIGEKDRLQRLGRLTDSCAVASAHRDIGLANTIGNKITSFAQEATSEQQVAAILRGILFAGAAFQDEDAWAEWLEEQLTTIAATVPPGDMSRVFLDHLKELKKVIKIDLCIHTRSEALSSAAI